LLNFQRVYQSKAPGPSTRFGINIFQHQPLFQKLFVLILLLLLVVLLLLLLLYYIILYAT